MLTKLRENDVQQSGASVMQNQRTILTVQHDERFEVASNT